LTGVHRGVAISDWKPFSKNTLKGFFSVTLPSGLVLHGVMLHEKSETRWISFPAREYLDQAGETQYARIVEFVDRGTANKFRDLVLEALDELIKASHEPR